MKNITRTVWILSLVSLLTDMASELLYPVMPVYLKSIGFSVVLIGVLEGIAEATAGLSKGYFGKRSDTLGRRLPFVQIGYALSAISKPMLAISIYPLWVFLSRTTDRLGKGIRTGARDAMLSDEATAETKGRIFGFHRAMDTLGAVAGPLLALIFLHLHPGNYLQLFYLAFVPGLLAVIASFFLKERKSRRQIKQDPVTFFSFLHYWTQSPGAYKKLVTGLLFFTLFNSSDVFLLLKARESGLSDTGVISVYIFYNLVYALFAFPAGILADRLGLKTIFMVGLAVFALVYYGMAFASNQLAVFGLFFLYGIYAATTEGISKAWISNITDKKDTATAIGTFSGLQSICTMLASALTGLIWFRSGANTAFVLTATATLLIMLYFLTVPVPHIHKNSNS